MVGIRIYHMNVSFWLSFRWSPWIKIGYRSQNKETSALTSWNRIGHLLCRYSRWCCLCLRFLRTLTQVSICAFIYSYIAYQFLDIYRGSTGCASYLVVSWLTWRISCMLPKLCAHILHLIHSNSAFNRHPVYTESEKTRRNRASMDAKLCKTLTSASTRCRYRWFT